MSCLRYYARVIQLKRNRSHGTCLAPQALVMPMLSKERSWSWITSTSTRR